MTVDAYGTSPAEYAGMLDGDLEEIAKVQQPTGYGIGIARGRAHCADVIKALLAQDPDPENAWSADADYYAGLAAALNAVAPGSVRDGIRADRD